MTHPATRVSVQIYSIRESGDLDQQLALIRACGYDHVETVALHGLKPADFAAKLAAHGLKPSSMHVALTTLEDAAQRADIVEGCRLSGCGLVIMPWLPMGERPATAAGWQALGQRLAVISDALAAHGLQLAYHNHEWEFLDYEGRTGLEWLFSATTPAQLKWEADLGWVRRAGADPLAWTDKLADRLVAVHAKDIAAPATAVAEDGWATLGQGIVGWERLLAALQPKVDLFVFEHDKPIHFEATLRDSRDFLRAQLGA
ncbi:MAG: hypothetical protein RJA44_120 [Pseudomonadota bacterium]|jgi:sugar phosphate isomerase/epimerase